MALIVPHEDGPTLEEARAYHEGRTPSTGRERVSPSAPPPRRPSPSPSRGQRELPPVAPTVPRPTPPPPVRSAAPALDPNAALLARLEALERASVRKGPRPPTSTGEGGAQVGLRHSHPAKVRVKLHVRVRPEVLARLRELARVSGLSQTRCLEDLILHVAAEQHVLEADGAG